ncbi:hypothetical protein [Fretibacter rubidus]|uniref:hypothetical protein n=1 Tax=Fretibacter rubidus TaxID=570162 RepID=UPI00352B6A5B
MRLFILIIAIVALFLPRPVSAQDTPDYGAIIRDIIQNGPIAPSPAPATGHASTIPVSLVFDLPPGTLSPQLIITATGEDNTPLSELRLTIDGLVSPLRLSLYTPPRVQTNRSFVMLKARIVDTDGITLSRTASDIMHTSGTAQLRLINQVPPSETPGPISALETVQGSVKLTDASDLFQGAILHVELIEAGLAGGRGNPVKGKVSVPIDSAESQTNGTVQFAFDYGVPLGGFKMPLGLKAYVTDWAGRTTHVMPNREEFTGPDKDYRLTLDRIRTGSEVEPFNIVSDNAPIAVPPQTNASAITALPPVMIISGEATFPAFRGLPRGAVLTVELWQRMDGVDTQVISRRAIVLDGLSGDVAFTLPPARATADPARIDPDMWLGGRITSQEGVVLFETNGQSVLGDTTRLVLTATPQY